MLLDSAFCLLAPKRTVLALRSIGKAMLNSRVEPIFRACNARLERQAAAVLPKIDALDEARGGGGGASPFTPTFNLPSGIGATDETNLERVLNKLQLLIKALLGELIAEAGFAPFVQCTRVKRSFAYLSELIARAIFYIKSKSVVPDTLDTELLFGSTDATKQHALKLLRCLGFTVQHADMVRVRQRRGDDEQRAAAATMCVLFPDQRYLDLNLRIAHVISCLVDLCFNERFARQSAPLFATDTEKTNLSK